MLASELRSIGDAPKSLGGFVRDNTEPMTTFAPQFVHQPPRFLMNEITRFATAVTQHRPGFALKIARHKNVPSKVVSSL